MSIKSLDFAGRLPGFLAPTMNDLAVRFHVATIREETRRIPAASFGPRAASRFINASDSCLGSSKIARSGRRVNWKLKPASII